MDYLQKFIDNMLEEKKREREKNNYNLGQFIKDLEKCNPNACVTINPFHLTPTGFCSYRGYYSDLCLDYDLDSRITVKELLEKAKSCINKTFYGYKGGEFEMNENSVVWIAPYGRTTDVILTGILDSFDDGSYYELTYKIERN